MADDARKIEIANRLSTHRASLSQNLRLVRHHLDLPAQVQSSFLHHKSAWLGSAAILGWVLSRLPARKKKVNVYVDRKDNQKLKIATEAGLMLGLGKLLFSTLQPAVTAFAAKKITDLVSRGGPTNRANKSSQR